MTSRREFLQAAAVISAAPLSIRAGEPERAALAISSVIVDERYAAARAFAAHALRTGIALQKISGDITGLWLTRLRPEWTSRATPIAGLTARPALFCLEHLAWEYRLRVIHHAEHRTSANGTTLHTAHIAARGFSAAGLTAAGAAWPTYAAGAISRLPITRSNCGPSTACMEAAVGDDETTLHSWVIA